MTDDSISIKGNTGNTDRLPRLVIGVNQEKVFLFTDLNDIPKLSGGVWKRLSLAQSLCKETVKQT